jgi:hypothetical protein
MILVHGASISHWLLLSQQPLVSATRPARIRPETGIRIERMFCNVLRLPRLRCALALSPCILMYTPVHSPPILGVSAPPGRAVSIVSDDAENGRNRPSAPVGAHNISKIASEKRRAADHNGFPVPYSAGRLTLTVLGVPDLDQDFCVPSSQIGNECQPRLLETIILFTG